MSHLFEPFTLRGVTLRNRIVVSPMCQYSCEDGTANDWHLVHLGSRAVGGAALVFCEATAVRPEARITPRDLGLWHDDHVEPLARVVRFLHGQGALAGIQLAHAGRKASTLAPWDGQGAIEPLHGGWQVVGPSGDAFTEGYPVPRAMSEEEIHGVVAAFVEAAGRAYAAGFDIVEIHAAHGYLLHEFLSPLSNRRDDRYGGSFDNRVRFLLETTSAVRNRWPEHRPLFVRLSTTDWVEGGWTIDETVAVSRRLAALGVDLIDCSSGGNVADARLPIGPGYQTAFAERVRREARIPTGAVGAITSPAQADHIIRSGQADCVLLARELLRDPYWPLRAARELGQPATWPVQYLRAAPAGSQPRAAQGTASDDREQIRQAAAPT